ncbi:MAG: gliding motility-associated ABC transporter permease subunit GldF [Flavobacteriales bacterium]|nr:gliding motility-associated ABC transporter permease subunit GldF [Flavobacteriales bacterium]
MFSIFKKEVRSFLSSLIAYVVVAVFLLAIGLFMWIYKDTNALDYGEANLSTLFFMAPWVFIFLISAITMRTFAEEQNTRTVELITTHPLTDWQIILGKYFAGLFLVVFALIPTVLYYITIYKLGSPAGNIDVGATMGSYLGLLFLGGCYVSIGLFASSLTNNMIVAFLLSAVLCFISYSVLGAIGNTINASKLSYTIEWLGIEHHYQSISRGVIDTRDVIYFVGFITFFLGLTNLMFGKRKW